MLQDLHETWLKQYLLDKVLSRQSIKNLFSKSWYDTAQKVIEKQREIYKTNTKSIVRYPNMNFLN